MDTIDDLIMKAANPNSSMVIKAKCLRPFKDISVAELHEFDETRAFLSDKIGSISIKSSRVNVCIKPRITRNIVVHLFGGIITEGEVHFNIFENNSLLEIFVSIGGTIKLLNNLTLEIEMPKRLLNNLSISCNNSSVVISSHN